MISEAERAAAVKVLRRWRSGRRLLAGYAVGATLLLWSLFSWDHRSSDLLKAVVIMTAAGPVLLVLVSVRNDWAGDALAEWRPDLVGPEKLVGDARLWRTGGMSYMTSLLAVAAVGLLLQNVTANLEATASDTAEVRDCKVSHSSGRFGRTHTTCYGEWTVAGKTYSGSLPGVVDGGEVSIHYDPDDPATLGDRSLVFAIGSVIILGLISGTCAWRWITVARDPYIAEVGWVTRRRNRKRPTVT